jgi:murein DD-endopeptidase MepM/ murein hydrolase activator NlpD
MRHLDPPYKGTPFVTQTFANASDVEPFGWKYTDGSIGYHWEAGAVYNRWHNGVDLALNDDTTLYAPEDGTVAVAGWDTTGFGWNVLIDHGGDLFTHVAHLKRYDVDAGQHVVRGQVIGHSDSTGNSTGPHLHWDVRSSDGMGYYYFWDPAPYLAAAPPVAPPSKAHPTGPAPTFPQKGPYVVTTAMYLRALPVKNAPHRALVPKGTILRDTSGPPSGQPVWTTHWRWVVTPQGEKGFAYAPNLA